eukprot:scaffold694_cov338-Pavlova_lutheri.AAC.11
MTGKGHNHVRGGGKERFRAFWILGCSFPSSGVDSNDEVDHPNALQLGTTPLEISCVPLTRPNPAQRGCFVPKDSYG